MLAKRHFYGFKLAVGVWRGLKTPFNAASVIKSAEFALPMIL
jgi:hypothetical protein